MTTESQSFADRVLAQAEAREKEVRQQFMIEAEKYWKEIIEPQIAARATSRSIQVSFENKRHLIDYCHDYAVLKAYFRPCCVSQGTASRFRNNHDDDMTTEEYPVLNIKW